MKKVNLHGMPWKEHKSPKGRFHLFYRDVAAAYRSARTGPKLPGPPPFEFELVKLPPGASNFPMHSHAAEWELYHVVSGTGTMRAGKKRVKIRAGDCLMCPPGEAHQITNTGRSPLQYHIIANRSETDVWHYPDSNKWGARAIGKFFRVHPVGYYDGEE